LSFEFFIPLCSLRSFSYTLFSVILTATNEFVFIKEQGDCVCSYEDDYIILIRLSGCDVRPISYRLLPDFSRRRWYCPPH